MKSVWTLGLLTAVVAATANANVVYTYEGNNFSSITDASFPSGSYDTMMKVTGSITLASAIAPSVSFNIFTPQVLDFSFSDGRGTLNKSNSLALASFGNFQTDGTGTIVGWDVELQDNAQIPFPACRMKLFRLALRGWARKSLET